MTAKLVYFGKLKADLPEWAAKVDDLPKTAAHQSNAISALNGLMENRGFKDEQLVGATLREDFYWVRDEHLAALKEQGRSRRFIASRKYLLEFWHVLIRAIDHDQAVVDGYMPPLQQALQALFVNDRKITPTARRVGMAPQTLTRWLTGALPRFGTEHHLRELEVHCGLGTNTLMDLLPYNPVRKGRDIAVVGEKCDYRNLLSEQQKDPYRMTARAASPLLRKRWRGLMAYKSEYVEGDTAAKAHDELASIMAEIDKAEAGEQDDEKTWRLDARSALDPPLDEEKRWFDVIGGFECPSAGMPFNYLASMVGWAARAKAKGGAGLKMKVAQKRGLGLFTDVTLALTFFKWRVARSLKLNGYAIGFLDFIAMLCHRDTGYLMTPEGVSGVGADNGFTEKQWLNRCHTACEWAVDYSKRMTPLRKLSNDPKVTLKKVLRDAMPLDNFMVGLDRLEGRRPTTEDIDEAIWARDTLLLAILISNPLRAKNLKRLTYYSDNSGQLYKTPGGEWKIRIDRLQFKNFKGAAKNKDYDQEVNSAFWPIIERYVRFYRKALGDARPELVFVSARNSSTIWNGLNARVAYLTERYVPGCENGGVRPHAFRHVVCSSIVIRTQNFILAADTLHDLPETVSRHYSHLLASVGNRGRAEILGSVYSKYTVTTERRRPAAVAANA